MGKESRFGQDRSKQAAASGTVFDSLGRQLQEGDAVVLSVQTPMIFRVMKIAPVFDPAAPAGTLQMQLICMASYTPKGGQALAQVLRVGAAEEMGPMPLKLIDQPAEEAVPLVDPGLPEDPRGPRLVLDADDHAE